MAGYKEEAIRKALEVIENLNNDNGVKKVVLFDAGELCTKENLEKSIEAHRQLQQHLMEVLKKTNFEGAGEEDAAELKKHYDTAIAAMELILCMLNAGGGV